ncbi:hypothetical protein DY000_02009509 [Brassica cretica]|uniref:Uncharacterized protein n=1 Tax=Brassica cretica TaxID=69181 RepID=A0ABQ7C519_BRACR|nr:hypothetical protein DY000_02009509 [Brassica cretica]
MLDPRRSVDLFPLWLIFWSIPSLSVIYCVSSSITDEDIKSSSENEKGTRSKSLENMKLRRAKEANQDICTIKTPYLTNHEDFIHETDFVGFYTQQEHAANWFHIKKINGFEDMPFSSQRWPDMPYLEDQEHILKLNVGVQDTLCYF